MKLITATTEGIVTNPNFIKITALALLSLSVLILFYHIPSIPSAISSTPSTLTTIPTTNTTITSFISPAPKKSPSSVVERTGIIDENGAMTVEFEIGDFDLSAMEELRDLSNGIEEEKGGGRNGVEVRVKYEKYKVCEEGKTDYIPCLDNADDIRRLNLSGSVEKSERHCPKEGHGLACLVPTPKGYRRSIPWPQSRDEIWFNNVPHTRLVEDKDGQNWIAKQGNKFVFPESETQFIHGANQYLDQISQMAPEIAFGSHTRVALDIGCGVASFGAFLLQRNVTTLSIAPHENQIQFALERGVPAMVAVFSTRRLLYPSQAFDLIHCSGCRVDWTHDDGILLLEANRMLRAGGYFVWAVQPIYKNEDSPHDQWKGSPYKVTALEFHYLYYNISFVTKDLTSCICWELVKKEGYIAIWRKPSNNNCYLNRDTGAHPPLCDPNDDPDNVWYVNLKGCISRLPENGYGANVTTWPTRLHYPPDRLHSIKMDACISRKEIFKAESKYWNDIIDSYVRAYHWKENNFRNVMDMRAGFGGFAAALHDLQVDSWVMNVVPVNEFNTLPVIYDRGLVGVIHDWCEPFDTYPRTYDLLHATGLFTAELKRQRCNISTIMLEMDRMLRSGGSVYMRDSVSVMGELQEIATALRWVAAIHDTGEGPHSSWKILICEKRMP